MGNQNPNTVPFEATTAYLTVRTLESDSVVAFMDGLDYEQKARFEELAHHLLHIGFEDGLKRPISAKEMSVEMQALQVQMCFSIMLEGADVHREIQGDIE